MKKLKDLAFELNNEIEELVCPIETLIDIEILLAHLRGSMDEAAYKGEEKAYYHEQHRQVRILSKLMQHTLEELSKKYDKAESFSTQLNGLIQRGEKI